MKPVVDGLKQQYEGKVEFRLINAETDPNGASLSAQYNVSAVPTFVFLNQDGTEATRLLGEVSKDQLTKTLDGLK